MARTAPAPIALTPGASPPVIVRDRCRVPVAFTVVPVGPRSVRVEPGPHPLAVATFQALPDSTPGELADLAAAAAAPALGCRVGEVIANVETYRGSPRALSTSVGVVLRLHQLLGRSRPSAGCVARQLRGEYPMSLVGAVIEDYERHR